MIGARKFLVAYNVNLNTVDKRLATRIAGEIREKGSKQLDDKGKPVLDAAGQEVWVPGLLPGIKAVGWTIPEFGCAQVSINVTDLDATPLHVVFDTCEERARAHGLRVTGSEIVGLVPRDVLLAAGRHYLARMGRSTGVPEAALVQVATRTLGLSEVKPFEPREAVIEYRLAAPAPLAAMTLAAFADELSSDSPAPGGGSVAAYAGALGAGLAAMVANLSHPKKGFEDRLEALERIAVRGQELKDRLLDAVDADTAAFDRYLAAMRMPKESAEEKAARDAALVDATIATIEVPMGDARGLPRDRRALPRSGADRPAGLALRRRHRRRAGARRAPPAPTRTSASTCRASPTAPRQRRCWRAPTPPGSAPGACTPRPPRRCWRSCARRPAERDPDRRRRRQPIGSARDRSPESGAPAWPRCSSSPASSASRSRRAAAATASGSTRTSGTSPRPRPTCCATACSPSRRRTEASPAPSAYREPAYPALARARLAGRGNGAALQPPRRSRGCRATLAPGGRCARSTRCCSRSPRWPRRSASGASAGALAGALAFALVAASPALHATSTQLMSENLAAAHFSLAGLGLLGARAAASVGRGSARCWCSRLLPLTRAEGLLLLPAALAVDVRDRARPGRRRRDAAAPPPCSLLGLVLPSALWLARNTLRVGHPVLSDRGGLALAVRAEIDVEVARFGARSAALAWTPLEAAQRAARARWPQASWLDYRPTGPGNFYLRTLRRWQEERRRPGADPLAVDARFGRAALARFVAAPWAHARAAAAVAVRGLFAEVSPAWARPFDLAFGLGLLLAAAVRRRDRRRRAAARARGARLPGAGLARCSASTSPRPSCCRATRCRCCRSPGPRWRSRWPASAPLAASARASRATRRRSRPLRSCRRRSPSHPGW